MVNPNSDFIVLTDPDDSEDPVVIKVAEIVAVYPAMLGKPKPPVPGEPLPIRPEKKKAAGVLVKTGNSLFVAESSAEVADRLTQSLAGDRPGMT